MLIFSLTQRFRSDVHTSGWSTSCESNLDQSLRKKILTNFVPQKVAHLVRANVCRSFLLISPQVPNANSSQSRFTVALVGTRWFDSECSDEFRKVNPSIAHSQVNASWMFGWAICNNMAVGCSFKPAYHRPPETGLICFVNNTEFPFPIRRKASKPCKLRERSLN